MMRRWFRRWFGRRRAVMERRPRMTEAELASCFRAAPEHPMWRGAIEVLDEAVIEAGSASTDPKIAGEQRAYYAGGMQALLDFKAELQRLAAAARTSETKEEKAA
jgi:hypothetical protein